MCNANGSIRFGVDAGEPAHGLRGQDPAVVHQLRSLPDTVVHRHAGADRGRGQRVGVGVRVAGIVPGPHTEVVAGAVGQARDDALGRGGRFSYHRSGGPVETAGLCIVNQVRHRRRLTVHGGVPVHRDLGVAGCGAFDALAAAAPDGRVGLGRRIVVKDVRIHALHCPVLGGGCEVMRVIRRYHGADVIGGRADR